MKYELVCGLETHIELSSESKIFCSCKNDFGGEPNTHCCPICIGLPGTLPKLNEEVVNLAIKAGLAVNCEINQISKMDRKNYVYPDLPKAYQISQYDLPLCKNGYIQLDSGKRIRIARIHIEEDAGKLIHKNGNVFIDYNRGGVPLIEIVTEPDIRNSDEVKEYVEKLQLIMRYIKVSDCKMQEGSMRCDVNISVRPEGQTSLGTRTEIKNMNSVTFMVKAVEYEKNRQIDLIENGGKVIQQTLRYREETGSTESMRGKEDAHDYRYFREPDLVTIETSEEKIASIKKSLPELPDVKFKRYVQDLGIPEKDATLLIKYRNVSEFFDKTYQNLNKPKIASNFIIGQIFGMMETESAKEIFNVNISEGDFNKLCKLVDQEKINSNLAKSALIKMLETGKSLDEVISKNDMEVLSEDFLNKVCKEVIEENQSAVSDYTKGKDKAIKALIGNVMRKTKGKASPQLTEKILINLIKLK